jgi:hypothetical protein
VFSKAALGLGSALLFASACGDDETARKEPEPTGDAAGVLCELGTMYPGVETIDPDAPVFEDASWPQSKVTDSFAQAKASGSTAYWAYKAARAQQNVLDCAFCSCGCAQGIGHKSAVDCFKDMHGFT